MQSTLTPKPTDDPHDVLIVAPDVALVAPTEEELARLAKLAHEALRAPSGPQIRVGPDFSAASVSAGPAVSAGPSLAGPSVPPVEATLRSAAVPDVHIPNDVQIPNQLLGQRSSMGRWAGRAFVAFLMAACTAAAGLAWEAHGDAAKQMIAKFAPQFVLTALASLEKPDVPAQPAAVEAAAADAAAPQSTPQAEPGPDSVAPAAAAPTAAALSGDSTQLLQSMARDLASVGQEMEQLKASIEQLKASQQQMSRDLAKASDPTRVSDQNRASAPVARQRTAALPPRPAVVRPRRPMSAYPYYPSTPAAAAPASPPPAAAPYPAAAAPYYPPRQQPESQPQAAAQPQPDPEVASVPRPPMPLR